MSEPFIPASVEHPDVDTGRDDVPAVDQAETAVADQDHFDETMRRERTHEPLFRTPDPTADPARPAVDPEA